jgi:hypothetical protein
LKIDKNILGVAGELAVASELCRRNIYAQLTFGNQKRTDLLVYHPKKYTRIEVKSKQGNDWPNCKGISTSDAVIIFVDYSGKLDTARPDFYVLAYKDWIKLVKVKEKEYRMKHTNRRTEIKNGCLYLLDELNKNTGKPYAGCTLKPKDMTTYKEKCNKIK